MNIARQISLACLLAAGCTSAVLVPDAIAPRAGETLLMSLPARGVQVYECRRQASGEGFEWAFVAPEAELLDARGRLAGSHGAGPYWQALDGSRVTAKVAARADAPESGAIPWLRLQADAASSAGTLGGVTSIQRVNTHGGIAPSGGCSRETVGRQSRVRYLAEYRFFTHRLER
jgi:hypothetical protein